jgi:hypothetical protein
MPALRTIALAGCVAWLLAPVAAQADPKACSEIIDDQARLKCFDGIFPGPAADAAWLSQPIEPPIPVRRVKTQRITADAPPAPEAGSVLERLIGTQ